MVTVKCTHAAAALVAALLLLSSSPASADGGDGADGVAEREAGAAAGEAPPAAQGGDGEAGARAAGDAGDSPAIHHAPISSAPEGEPLAITVTMDAPHLVKSAHVVYRAGEKWLSVRLLRSGDAEYSGVIPGEQVKAPGLGYAIEMERADGVREAVFASRAALQPVVVHPDATDERERWLNDRVEGRRSVVSVSGELVRFGTTQGKAALPCGAGQEGCPAGATRVPQVDDQYWKVGGSYTYRPLRTVSEFGFRLGVVRGRSLVDVREYDDSKFDVGLNYAGANVRFRVVDLFHVDLEALGSVTEIGFSMGAGAAVVLGDPLAFKFTLGWQTIGFTNDTYFGTRFYTRLDLPVTSRITVAPNVEVTDMPHAGDFGVRLLADGGFVLGRGFTLWVRGGYQARISRSGGPAAGATLQFGF